MTTFDFRDGAKGWQGSFSAPALRALRVPLARVSFAPPRVHFELVGDFQTTLFDGELSGNDLSGSFREGKAQGTFRLDRGQAPAAKYREENIRFSNGAVELAGTLLLPLGAGPHPAVYDGGQSWTEQRGCYILYAASFVDANTGTAVGTDCRPSGQVILRTEDGGKTWTPQFSRTTSNLYGVYFVDANIGTAVGEWGRILRTEDGGNGWMVQAGPP